MPATFTANRPGIRAMCATEDMARAMERRAERGKAFAESIAPVKTGQYKYGAHLLNDRNDPGGHRRRSGLTTQPLPEGKEGGFHVGRITTPEGYAGARVVNRSGHAYFLEHGTKYMAAQHVMARSLDAMR